MGVKGLWRLLLPIGRRISIETLEGQVLAIDASIWLTQFIKAMRDKESGKVLPAAHLIGFFKRLCRLRYHNIKPIFIFDGATPEIKHREILARRKKRTNDQFILNEESIQRLAKRLLSEQLKKKNQKEKASNKPIFNNNNNNKNNEEKTNNATDNNKSKEKTSVNNNNNCTSFAAGFNPGSGQVAVTTTTAIADDEEENKKNDQNKEEKDDDDEIEIIDAGKKTKVDQMKNGEEDYNDMVVDDDEVEEINDWDIPVDTAITNSRNKNNSNDNDDSNDDDDDEWEDPNDFFVLENDNDDFNFTNTIAYISSLPSHERKNAIEQAKRQQRLRSRKEFMPAAANMDQFSQTQITNFLRSSKLNQSIQQMATTIANRSNDNNTDSFFLASDRTTRIELIREKKYEDNTTTNNNKLDETDEDNEDDNEDDDTFGENIQTMKQRIDASKQKRTNIPPRKRKTIGIMKAQNKKKKKKHRFVRFAKTSVAVKDRGDDDNNNDDDDDNIDWEEGLSSSPKVMAVASLQQDDDDDNDDSSSSLEEDDNNEVSPRRVRQKRRQKQQQQHRRRAIHNSDEDEDIENDDDNNNKPCAIKTNHGDDDASFEGSGFIPSTSESQLNTTLLSSSKQDLQQHRRRTIRNNDNEDNDNAGDNNNLCTTNTDDEDENASCEGGGFIPSTSESHLNTKLISSSSKQESQSSSSTHVELNDKNVHENNLSSLVRVNTTKVIEINDDDDEDTSIGGGGGFIATDLQEYPPSERLNKNNLNVAQESRDSTLSVSERLNKNNKDDAIYAQELEDRGLAEAMQEAEFSFFAVSNGTKKPAANIWHRNNEDDADKKELQIDRQIIGIDEDEEDDVDWEDGDVEECKVGMKSKSLVVDTMNQKPFSLNRHLKKVDNDVDEDKDDDVEIKWMDGDDDNDATRDNGEKVTNKEKLGDAPQKEQIFDDITDSKRKLSDLICVLADNQHVSEDENSDSLKLSRDKINYTHEGEPNSGEEEEEEEEEYHSKYENAIINEFENQYDFVGNAGQSNEQKLSAALEQAQATAANLTNWAGRAFRLAMKEVTGISESPTKPVVPSPTVQNESTPIASPSQHGTGISLSSKVSKDDSFLMEAKVVPVERDTPDSKNLLDDYQRNSTAQSSSALSYYDMTDSVKQSLLYLENDDQWELERNRKERDMDTVTDEMRHEAMQLLQLFGVPYVIAPAEAEAQCAALEQLGLVNGIVTEDSDVFVFGGKTVYKNIFDEQKYAEVYAAPDAQREMNIGRNSFVALAMLLGGDYTEGVKGVGIVNAMELLEAFDVSEDLMEGLQKFRKWLDGFDPVVDGSGRANDRTTEGSSTELSKELSFHAKHRSARTRWVPPPNFPSEYVVKAYLDPVVDKSTERFTWGTPDVENLILFCSKFIGWTPEDTTKFLNPVMEQLMQVGNGRLRQTRIDSFMKYEDSIKFADIRSKRLRDVLQIRKNKQNSTNEQDEIEVEDVSTSIDFHAAVESAAERNKNDGKQKNSDLRKSSASAGQKKKKSKKS